MVPLRALSLLALAGLTLASPAEAQRFEASVLGGMVSPSGKEYERVTIVGPTTERVRSTEVASQASSRSTLARIARSRSVATSASFLCGLADEPAELRDFFARQLAV